MADAVQEPEAVDRKLDEYEELVARRWVNLLKIGFTPDQIERLHPEKAGFDWHRADVLVKAGCDPETAVRILA
jgi:hypothetical protein